METMNESLKMESINIRLDMENINRKLDMENINKKLKMENINIKLDMEKGSDFGCMHLMTLICAFFDKVHFKCCVCNRFFLNSATMNISALFS